MDWENKLRLKINAAESIMYLIVLSCLMYLQVSEKLFDYMGFVHSLIFFGIFGLFTPETDIEMSLLFIFGGALWFYLFRKL